MRSLYVRIWLTVLVALALFGGLSGWLFQRHVSAERERIELQSQSRAEAWADLLQRSLPSADAPREEQAAGLRDWAQRLRLPLALDDARGQRIGASDSYLRREGDAANRMHGMPGLSPEPGPRRGLPIQLADGRTLWIARPLLMRRPAPGEGPEMGPREARPHPLGAQPLLPGLPASASLVILVVLLFLAVGAGAYPVVRRLTRRLEELKKGVEAFGAGALHHRVNDQGRDEVAAVAASFNEAAGRIEALLRSHQNLLANASHELRSPLARLKMAVSLLDDAAPAQQQRLKQEIHTNIGELDALVEEVLLASRLDAARDALSRDPVDLLALAAEEGSRVQAEVQGETLCIEGDERLLRRALRNLLENARRYGGGEIQLHLAQQGALAELRVCDRGPGVPQPYRERIFEAFFRLPGHAEREGGVGLGLALVQQIARRHGGSVRCEAREGGGSCFVLSLPMAAAAEPAD
ncbi:MAG: HAMP domain-containing histidine kinase [Rubrivivax sp.]|nr:HAMP domain-containing histidine kinase [Rubrivivax sp.]